MGVLERLKIREKPAKAALYARFSSDNQRNESIDAQLRAMNEFAHVNNTIVVAEYIDKAKSAMTDDRPQFQNMLRDSAKKNFDILLVHKLDRFARNRNDSIMNRSKLRRNGVFLLSTTEPLDDEKPESIILEAVLEAMAEYYSKNLAREVRKGLKENALKCKHTGLSHVTKTYGSFFCKKKNSQAFNRLRVRVKFKYAKTKYYTKRLYNFWKFLSIASSIKY